MSRGRPTRAHTTSLAGAALAVLALAGSAAADFTQRFEGRLSAPLGRALADSVGRSLPVTSASSGITFRFDFATGAFERETELLGQLFLERAEPLGRGKWNVATSWQWVRFDTVDGRDLDELRDSGPPIVDPDTGLLVAVPRFGIDLETHEITTSVTYGLTDAIDVNVTLPVLTSTFDVDAVARNVSVGGLQPGVADDEATGVGDLFLRAKYRFGKGRFGSLAAGFVLRLPTGDEDDLMGTGELELSPLVYASSRPWRPVRGVRITAYANLGVDVAATDVDRSEARMGFGVDCSFHERVTLAAAVLGREPFDRLAPAGSFDVVRRNPRTGRTSTGPFLGLDTGRPQYWDLALGGRIHLWRDTVFLTGNVLLPLNDDGFRSDVIPLIGLEATF